MENEHLTKETSNDLLTMQSFIDYIAEQAAAFDRQMFKGWGFAGIKDYIVTIFGLNLAPFFNFQIIGSIAAGFIAWFAEWIWNPPVGAALIIAMTFINARYGYLVSKKIKKESFNFRKFNRTFSVVAADLLIMAIITTAIRIKPYYEPMADILFGWYFANKLRQIIYHMTLLKLQQGGLAQFLKNYILQLIKSKIGPALVDSLQESNINPAKFADGEILKSDLPNSENDGEPRAN